MEEWKDGRRPSIPSLCSRTSSSNHPFFHSFRRNKGNPASKLNIFLGTYITFFALFTPQMQGQSYVSALDSIGLQSAEIAVFDATTQRIFVTG
jgi:hypothetical protein